MNTIVVESTGKIQRITNRLEKTQPDFTALAKQVRDEGLLKKNPAFYIVRFAQITVITILLIIGVFLLHGNPWALLLAPFLGIMGAQYGFIGHEAAHKQIFVSGKKNSRFALLVSNLFVGLSYGWWDKKKHNLHHANPNMIDKDPDINLNVLAFTKESYDNKKGVEKLLTKNQGFLFPFLLMFTGFDLLVSSYNALLSTKSDIENRVIEITLITVRTVVPFVALFFLFNPFIAISFWLIQMMIFGLFMGGAFAPNHKGMPIIPRNSKVDFFRKQVLTARDIKGNWLIDNLMGGLNYQVEHHLFPSMPRSSLIRAQEITKLYCAEKNVLYVETRLFESYAIVMRYLSRVGLQESDPFECPMVSSFRRVD